jgi:hypothetical protein
VRVLATVRAAEVAFMVLAPTLFADGVLGDASVRATDVFALTLMIGGVAGLAMITWQAFAPDAIRAAVARSPVPKAAAPRGRLPHSTR